MYISIIFLPLMASLLANNKYTGVIGGPLLSSILLFISTLLSLIAFFEVGFNQSPVSIDLGDWITCINVRWEFLFDSVTVTILLPVMIISTCVQIYSREYLKTDPHICRFFSLISLFTFSMVLLVTADNLFIVFMGWELVGLVSYLLVNYWFTSTSNNGAALKALFMNKIGDWAFLLVLFQSLAIFHDLSFSTLFAVCHLAHPNLLLLLLLAFLLAASAKSAQLGLHSWLSAAMAGPTSVSSLLHSSTMVTAGVILLIRISPMLEYSSTALLIILWLGSLTALLGASCGLVDYDIKRVIAFSTSSQLGYLFVACGLSQYSLALTHLLNHAWFKSLLFLASGAFIHAVFDQDLRKMGSLVLLTPLSYLVFLLGSFSLVAFPFFTGFYSKDLLLEILIAPLNFTHSFAYLFTLIAAFFTSTYSIRLLMMAMYSQPNFPLAILPFVKDSSSLMTFPLLFLSLGAVTFGYLSHEFLLGFGSTFYGQSLFILPEHSRLLDAIHFVATWETSPFSLLFSLFPLLFLLGLFFSLPFPTLATSSLLPVSVSTTPIGRLGILLPLHHSPFLPSPTFATWSTWRFSHFFDPSLMNHFNTLNYQLIKFFFSLSIYSHRYLDKGFLEFFGPTGIFRLIHWLAFHLELLSTGFLPHYGSLFLAFLVAILFHSNLSLLLYLALLVG
jgi:NADH-ubiquinone oxidoreductase chain 5